MALLCWQEHAAVGAGAAAHTLDAVPVANLYRCHPRCRRALESECTGHAALARQHIAAAAGLPAAVSRELDKLQEASKPYCLCKTLYDEARPMLGCDYCQEVRCGPAALLYCC